MSFNRKPAEERRDERESKLEALRAALIEGEQSGQPMPFDFDAFIQEMHRKPERRE